MGCGPSSEKQHIEGTTKSGGQQKVIKAKQMPKPNNGEETKQNKSPDKKSNVKEDKKTSEKKKKRKSKVQEETELRAIGDNDFLREMENLELKGEKVKANAK